MMAPTDFSADAEQGGEAEDFGLEHFVLAMEDDYLAGLIGHTIAALQEVDPRFEESISYWKTNQSVILPGDLNAYGPVEVNVVVESADPTDLLVIGREARDGNLSFEECEVAHPNGQSMGMAAKTYDRAVVVRGFDDGEIWITVTLPRPTGYLH